MPAALLALDDRVAVAGQLKPDDMAEIAAAGYVAVVNNRPDGEALFGQPRTADLRAAAEAAGLVFLDLPFSGPRATPEQVRAFASLLAARPGRVVAFCKSGMRSALMWGAAAIASGRSLDEVLAAALRAGQNLDPLGETMVALAKSAQA
ncbi:MAG: TIGR01244 family sulfur transferase [Reyranella sp.]|nr:TIGR01244 family sulfur transferase [Reyranella sp.]MDP3162491.1 TIGR01244 family sulfur transferase [Reyranella sp.]